MCCLGAGMWPEAATVLSPAQTPTFPNPLLIVQLFASALAQLTPAAVMQHLPLDEPNRPWVICTAGPWALTAYAASDEHAETDWIQSPEDKIALERLDLFPVGIIVEIKVSIEWRYVVKPISISMISVWGVWLDARDDDASYQHVIDLIKQLEDSASKDVDVYIGSLIAGAQHAAHVLLALEPAYATTVNF